VIAALAELKRDLIGNGWVQVSERGSSKLPVYERK